MISWNSIREPTVGKFDDRTSNLSVEPVTERSNIQLWYCLVTNSSLMWLQLKNKTLWLIRDFSEGEGAKAGEFVGGLRTSFSPLSENPKIWWRNGWHVHCFTTGEERSDYYIHQCIWYRFIIQIKCTTVGITICFVTWKQWCVYVSRQAANMPTQCCNVVDRF